MEWCAGGAGWLQVLFQLCVTEDPISAVITADTNIVRALVEILRQQVWRRFLLVPSVFWCALVAPSR
jgi:hypothetical protein